MRAKRNGDATRGIIRGGYLTVFLRALEHLSHPNGWLPGEPAASGVRGMNNFEPDPVSGEFALAQ
jgi:hypothetical protein